jgi:hypothetical protein
VNRWGAILFAVLTATASSAAEIEARPSEFDFATDEIGSFHTVATTSIDWSNGEPRLQGVTCVGQNQDIRFVVDGTGRLQQLQVTFLREKSGDREGVSVLLGDSLWLFVDGKRFEYRNVSVTDRFANYRYVSSPAGTIILADFRGYQGVREHASDPFMNLSRIYSDIVRAKSLRWAFKSRNWNQVDASVPENALPRGWQHRRYRIDNEHLKGAVDWCTSAVASDRAQYLPPQFAGSVR